MNLVSCTGTVTLIGDLQAKWPWPQRFTLRLPRGAKSTRLFFQQTWPSRGFCILSLVCEFFDQIAKGEKLEEYRDRTECWKTRFEGRGYDIIRFRTGYGGRSAGHVE